MTMPIPLLGFRAICALAAALLVAVGADAAAPDDVADPNSWTPARPILDGGPKDPRKAGGLDYWIICDEHRAYLFLTSLNGKMWRLWTKLEDFPRGFDHCELSLEARIFEASHTYKLKGLDKYLTIVEENGRPATRRSPRRCRLSS